MRPRVLVDSPTGRILDTNVSNNGADRALQLAAEAGEGYTLADRRRRNGPRAADSGPVARLQPMLAPDGGIAFLSTRNPQFAYCWHAPVGVLHRMNADGSTFKLSANYLNDFTPAVLDDGRIIYTRWEYVDGRPFPSRACGRSTPTAPDAGGLLWQPQDLAGDFHGGPQIPGTTKIICTMTGHNGPNVGRSASSTAPRVPTPRRPS